MNIPMDTDIRFKLLSLLKEKPNLTQREMKQEMGISLGKVNFCVSFLAQKGLIRIERFKNASKKTAYLYRITPAGLKELTHLALKRLKIRIQEYDEIKKEINILFEQVQGMDDTVRHDTDLLQDVKRII